MTVTNVGILGDRIIQVHRILDYVKALPANKRETIKEIYSALKDSITSEGQVGSTVQYYHKKEQLSRAREGASHYYWGKRAQPAQPAQPASPVGLSTQADLEPIGPTHEIKPIQTNRPEIRVEKDRIIIEHAKCRIIVELL